MEIDRIPFRNRTLSRCFWVLMSCIGILVITFVGYTIAGNTAWNQFKAKYEKNGLDFDYAVGFRSPPEDQDFFKSPTMKGWLNSHDRELVRLLTEYPEGVARLTRDQIQKGNPKDNQFHSPRVSVNSHFNLWTTFVPSTLSTAESNFIPCSATSMWRSRIAKKLEACSTRSRRVSLVDEFVWLNWHRAGFRLFFYRRLKIA